MTRMTYATGILGLLVLAGCTAATPSSSEASPTESSPSPITISAAPTGGVLPAELAASIVADAAALTGVDQGEVVIVSAEATTWNDGALGCPEPGVNYTQALVDGYRVIVSAAEVEIDYRTGNGGSFRRCEPFQPGG